MMRAVKSYLRRYPMLVRARVMYLTLRDALRPPVWEMDDDATVCHRGHAQMTRDYVNGWRACLICFAETVPSKDSIVPEQAPASMRAPDAWLPQGCETSSAHRWRQDAWPR